MNPEIIPQNEAGAMRSIKIVVPGEPQAYRERARTFIRAKPGKQGQPVGSIGVSSYKPKHAESYQAVVRALAIEAMGEQAPLEGPVNLSIVAYVPIPASMPKFRQREAREGLLLPTKRPDLTQILKLAEDALNEVVWRDDKQVVATQIIRCYSARPRLEMQVWEQGRMGLQAIEFHDRAAAAAPSDRDLFAGEAA